MSLDRRERPQVRREDLVIQALGAELLIFDATVNRAHSLNPTAATVWQACDGTRSLDQLADHCQLDPAAVQLALQDLAETHLIEGYTPPTERISRRHAIQRLAIGGAALGVTLPVVRSIVAPSLAMAGSTAGSACASQSDCTGTGSHCHSDGTCQHSTCAARGSHPGSCHPGHPCCYGMSCHNESGSYVCYGTSGPP